MTTPAINGVVIFGRRGHRCAILYEDDRYVEAMYAVHRWRQEGLIDMDESSHLMDRIASAAGVCDGSAEGRVGRDPTDGGGGAVA